jgi:monoterpene epsilon-lactone hydrolase
MSPLTSSDMGLKYQALKEHRDAMFPFMTVKFIYDVFATVNGTRPPPVMPPESDLAGLGPFLLQVGTHEMLVNDTFALADRLQAHDVPVWVQVWHKAMHMFQLSFDVNPDARRAVREVAIRDLHPPRDERAGRSKRLSHIRHRIHRDSRLTCARL